jgi:WhiB family redox-sensing transcriptional regulator
MTDWRKDSLCGAKDPQGQNIHDPELFFPVGTTGPAVVQTKEAKAVCRACPVMSQCLTWALDSGQGAGVWGGLSEDERRALKRHARARASQGSTSSAPRPPRHVDVVAVARLKTRGRGSRYEPIRPAERDAVIHDMTLEGYGYTTIAERLRMSVHTTRASIAELLATLGYAPETIAIRLCLSVARVTEILESFSPRDREGVA